MLDSVLLHKCCEKCKLFSVFFRNGEYCEHIDDDISSAAGGNSPRLCQHSKRTLMSRCDPPTMASAATSTEMSSTWRATVQQGCLAVALLRVSRCMYA